MFLYNEDERGKTSRRKKLTNDQNLSSFGFVGRKEES